MQAVSSIATPIESGQPTIASNPIVTVAASPVTNPIQHGSNVVMNDGGHVNTEVSKAPEIITQSPVVPQDNITTSVSNEDDFFDVYEFIFGFYE